MVDAEATAEELANDGLRAEAASLLISGGGWAGVGSEAAAVADATTAGAGAEDKLADEGAGRQNWSAADFALAGHTEATEVPALVRKRAKGVVGRTAEGDRAADAARAPAENRHEGSRFVPVFEAVAAEEGEEEGAVGQMRRLGAYIAADAARPDGHKRPRKSATLYTESREENNGPHL